jgi:hypothetical protein
VFPPREILSSAQLIKTLKTSVQDQLWYNRWRINSIARKARRHLSSFARPIEFIGNHQLRHWPRRAEDLPGIFLPINQLRRSRSSAICSTRATTVRRSL